MDTSVFQILERWLVTYYAVLDGYIVVIAALVVITVSWLVTRSGRVISSPWRDRRLSCELFISIWVVRLSVAIPMPFQATLACETVKLLKLWMLHMTSVCTYIPVHKNLCSTKIVSLTNLRRWRWVTRRQKPSGRGETLVDVWRLIICQESGCVQAVTKLLVIPEGLARRFMLEERKALDRW